MKKISFILILIFNFSQKVLSQNEKFYAEQSIKIDESKIVDSATALKIYEYFKNLDLFILADYNNCEDI